jgi:hypothetical protein
LFIGDPALILAVFFGMKRRWSLFLGAALAATIGQADLYNTMCHIHTPLFYSLLRSFHAVWIGGLIGWVAVVIFDAVLKFFPNQPTTPTLAANTQGSLDETNAAPDGLASVPLSEGEVTAVNTS